MSLQAHDHRKPSKCMLLRPIHLLSAGAPRLRGGVTPLILCQCAALGFSDFVQAGLHGCSSNWPCHWGCNIEPWRAAVPHTMAIMGSDNLCFYWLHDICVCVYISGRLLIPYLHTHYCLRKHTSNQNVHSLHCLCYSHAGEHCTRGILKVATQ
jgi:hypothetical protein